MCVILSLRNRYEKDGYVFQFTLLLLYDLVVEVDHHAHHVRPRGRRPGGRPPPTGFLSLSAPSGRRRRRDQSPSFVVLICGLIARHGSVLVLLGSDRTCFAGPRKVVMATAGSEDGLPPVGAVSSTKLLAMTAAGATSAVAAELLSSKGKLYNSDYSR